MAADAAFLIHLGSAILFMLLGLAILAVGRRQRGPLALGAFLICYAMVTVFTNVRIELAQAKDPYESAWLYLGSVPFVLAAGVFGFLAAAWLPRTKDGWRTAVGIGFLVGLPAVLGMVDYSISADATNVGVPADLIGFRSTMAGIYSVPLAGMLATSAWRVLQTRPATKAEWIRAMSFTILLAPGLLAAWPSRFGQPWSLWTLTSMVVLIAGLTLPLLILAAHANRAAARWALLWPAMGLLSYAYLLLPANADVAFHDAYGLNGVLRVLGWAFLVYAILRADLLGVRLPHFAVSRGAVAAGSLAVLFIVAQVMQNFFSAEYGLLTGGVIAGTFLFAASPVQRAFERMGEKRPAGDGRGRPASASAGKEQEAAYRDAVRLALRDRRFEPAEEIALANLADRLGLTAMRAIEIRLAVEQERGLR